MYGRELEILNILQGAEKPLIVTDIVNMQPDLTHSTVTTVLRKLLREGLVEVDGSVHSGKVPSRTFKCTDDAKDSVLRYYKTLFQQTNNIVTAEDILALLK